MVKLTAIGNISNDASVLVNGANKSIAFNVASTKAYKNNEGQKVQETTWIKCYGQEERFRNVAKFIKKGVKVYIRGNMSLHKWKNEKTKQLEIDIRCHLEEIQLLDKKEKYSPEVQEKFDKILQAATERPEVAAYLKKITGETTLVEQKTTKTASVTVPDKNDEPDPFDLGEITEQQDDLPF